MCEYESFITGKCTLNECMYYPISNEDGKRYGLCESIRKSLEDYRVKEKQISDMLTLKELKDYCIKTLQAKEMIASQINGIRFQSDKVEQECRIVLDSILEHEAQVRAEARAEIHTALMNELAELNESGLTESNLITFVYRIKDITEKLKEKQK